MIANACPARDRLHDYLQGALPAAEAEVVDEHLSECSECQAAMETWEEVAVPKLGGLVAAARGEAVADPLLQKLLARAKSIPLPDTTPDRTRLTRSVAEPAPGQLIGQYELLELIGRGGMGAVYKAFHRRMKRTVALKLLPQGIFAGAEMRGRFDREIETAAKLTHPNIVTAYDAGEDRDLVFLVMEFVDGPDLARRVQQQGALPVTQAVRYICQAARGLGHAHAAGVIHRDVKPANLLLAPDGTVKVSDLGLAKLLAEQESRGKGEQGEESSDSGSMVSSSSPALLLSSSPAPTKAGRALGTVGYMAPEQGLNPAQSDHRADVYSLGCSLFYLLTGNPPYPGSTTLEILCAHRDQPIPDIATLRAECPPALAVVVQRMLAKRPEERYASMSEVITALERAMPDHATHLTSTSASIAEPGPDTRAALPRRRHVHRRWIGVALAIAATILLPLTLYWPNGLFGHHLADGDPTDLAGADPKTDAKQPGGQTGNQGTGKQPGSVSGQTPDKARAPELELVRIEAGDFLMGASDSDGMAAKDEKPQHKIEISQPFFLGKFPVTQAQFQHVMGENPSAFSSRGRYAHKVKDVDTGTYPVESVSWDEAVKFCNRLSDMHGLKPYYKIGGGKVLVQGGPGFRLPTEAEWEFACRGGSMVKGSYIWSFGNDSSQLGQYAWFADNAGGKTHPVGEKKANPLGLFDMHGNVPQWCWDRYQADYYSTGGKVIDPVGPGVGDVRVYRGGGWDMKMAKTRSSARNSLNVEVYGHVLTMVGFRVAKNAE
jgi:serine/threonine protein kinase